MNILIFGDSITWGACDREQGGWATRLRNYFEARDGDVDVYNLGVSGDITTDVIVRMEGEMRAREPDMVVIAIGVNDAQFIHSTDALRTSPEEFQQNLIKIFDLAKQYTNKIIFVGITRVDESKTTPTAWNIDKSYFNKNIVLLDTIIEEFCRAHALKFISMADVIETNDTTDGFHPDASGHVKMFECMRPEIEALL